ncbi:hypothetical protein AURDEDRAFT_181288 [Auricularia subglabra TFB-10046 SS5]|nr:hypothetical protein AURDEDRAFT_181288 [Auricularia subglabra TFB-10046 SS5]
MSFAPIPTAVEAAAIGAEIMFDEARVVALEAELAALKASIDEKKFLVAPIRRLPWEMLAALFSASVVHDPFFILTLSQVCRAFRRAALISPSLWAALTINVSNRHCESFAGLFLERSGSVPLTIVVPRPAATAAMCHHHHEEYTRTVCTVMRVVHNHQDRLRSLDLNVGSLDTAESALAVCAGPAPKLQRLHVTLDCDQERDKEELSALKTAFQPCPALYDLMLQHCTLPVRHMSTEQGRFANVLSLSLNHLHSPTLHLKRVVAHLPNLKALTCLHWRLPDDELDISNIVVPTLRTLSIVDESHGLSGARLLRSLTAPNLKKLLLQNLFDFDALSDDDEDFASSEAAEIVGEAVRDFLQRSGYGQLVKLELSHSEMPPEDLVYVLRRAEFVEELTLAGTKLAASVWKNLAARPKRKACVPRMHTLVVGDTYVKPKQVLRVIDARNLAPDSAFRPLRLLKFNNCTGVGENDRMGWAALDPARLVVECTNSPLLPPRPVDFMSDMLDAMMFGLPGLGPLYF